MMASLVTGLSLLMLANIAKGESSDARYYTCADWMSNHNYNELTDGVYTIINSFNESSSIDVYCVFDYINHYAWTTIESGAKCPMRSSDEMKYADFGADLSYNMDNVDDYKIFLYRLNMNWMDSIRSRSHLLLSSCNFDTTFTKDWVLLDLTETNYNPFETEYIPGSCTSVVSANIRGHTCVDNTVRNYQDVGAKWHWHIDSSDAGCGCNSWTSSSVPSEDNFGFYNNINTEFTCMENEDSTTNYLLGSVIQSYNNIDVIEPIDPSSVYLSCSDWMATHEYNELSNGIYTINKFENTWTHYKYTQYSSLDVYCVFDYTRNYSWTLIESASFTNMQGDLRATGFDDDVSYNMENVEEYRNDKYRLSNEWIDSMLDSSKIGGLSNNYLFLASCNFDTSFTQDWVLMNLDETQYNPFTYNTGFYGQCTDILSANIRGNECEDSSISVWQGGPYGWHINCGGSCGCEEVKTDCVGSEDDFGYYVSTNSAFTCSATKSSTTNFFIGTYHPPNSFTDTSSDYPTPHPTPNPTVNPTDNPTVGSTTSGVSTMVPSSMPTFDENEVILSETCSDGREAELRFVDSENGMICVDWEGSGTANNEIEIFGETCLTVNISSNNNNNKFLFSFEPNDDLNEIGSIKFGYYDEITNVAYGDLPYQIIGLSTNSYEINGNLIDSFNNICNYCDTNNNNNDNPMIYILAKIRLYSLANNEISKGFIDRVIETEINCNYHQNIRKSLTKYNHKKDRKRNVVSYTGYRDIDVFSYRDIDAHMDTIKSVINNKIWSYYHFSFIFIMLAVVISICVGVYYYYTKNHAHSAYGVYGVCCRHDDNEYEIINDENHDSAFTTSVINSCDSNSYV